MNSHDVLVIKQSIIKKLEIITYELNPVEYNEDRYETVIYYDRKKTSLNERYTTKTRALLGHKQWEKSAKNIFVKEWGYA